MKYRCGAFLALMLVCRVWAAELPSGFVVETVVENLNAATAMTVSPDGRVFVGDQTGLLHVVKDGKLLPAPFVKVEVDDYWERGLIGVTLDPAFPTKPFVYVDYIAKQPYPHHRVSRFTANGDVAVPGSEKVLLEGDDQRTLGGKIPAGHQGGPLRFGADGKLHIALGEQTAGEPSQSLTTFQGKLLRIDSDGGIPADNPFYTRTSGKYRAIWAIGLRNPFGLAVQPGTGRMFFTDVGGSAFEEVNEAIAGANYGWPKAEGYSKDPQFKSPLYAYPPVIGRSVAGGVFYNPGRAQFPERYAGKFFFVDYMAHWLKVLDPANPKSVTSFGRNFNGPVDVQLSPDGCLYVLNRGAWVRDKKFVANAGSLARIRYVGESAAVVDTAKAAYPVALGLPARAKMLPKRLSATGFFESLHPLKPREGLLPCELNAPVWEPGVKVSCFVALPLGAKIGFSANDDWHLPPGTVFVQQFAVDAAGSGKDKPLETRLIVTGVPCGYGAAYRWRDDGSDADRLVDGEVAEVPAGARRKGRYWFHPGIEDCLTFPTTVSAYVLPLNTRQLNRPVRNDAGEMENQLSLWSRRGVLDTPLRAEQITTLPRLAPLGDTTASPELRVRSYLDANCAMCHFPGGPSRSTFDARFITPLAQSGLVNGELLAGDLGIAGARVMVPGSLEKSVLYQRLKKMDFFRMPPVAFHNEAAPVLPVLEEWIKSLP
ncbi:MAG: PQQ-dependent sugar dehydrogenase [Verrucomicrobiota bacterium]